MIPIAGDLKDHGGGEFKWEAARLRTEAPKGDGDDEGKGDKAEVQGLKVTLTGGMYEHREQRAVVELRCNATMTGLESEWESEDEYVKPKGVDRRDGSDGKDKDKDDKGGEPDDGSPETQRKKDGAALIWQGYKNDGNVDTLYLTWHTKHACEKAAAEEPAGEESKHWGLFTWLIIL